MFFLWFPSSTSSNDFLWFPSLVVYGFRRCRNLFMVSTVVVFMASVGAGNISLRFPCLQQQAKAEAQGLHKVYTRSTRGLHKVCRDFFSCYGFRLLQDRGCLSEGNRTKTRQGVSKTNYVYIYIYIDIFVYMCMCIYIYIYIYICLTSYTL